MPLTKAQELAATSRGGSRLVSAAAGSGKTKVLVERLLRRVEHGADIDDFLVVTYTRAAAGELRVRIGRELNTLLAARPGDLHLRRQTQLLCRADIGTIDSFCGRLLRENTHLAALAPDFRVVEPDRADAIRSAALERVMDALYETLDADPAMEALVNTLGAGRNDRKLTELVLRLHSTVQSHPDPAAWLREQRRRLSAPPGTDAGETIWGRWLLASTRAQACYWEERLNLLLTELLQPGNEKRFTAYGPTLETTLDGLRDVIRASGLGWDRTRDAVRSVSFPRAGSWRGGDDPLIDEVKAARETCKKKTAEKWAELFEENSAELLRELAESRDGIDALLRLTERLDREYAEAKKRQNVVDFSDQEHMVLSLLEDESNGLARSVSQRYEEVLVDEYQDVNACQDRLFTLLSDNGRRLFCVGDVKQSIYRFRLADPTIFLDKYERWDDVFPEMPEGVPGRILLRENFRSRPEVLGAANHVFAAIMSRELGEMEYDSRAALRPGKNSYPEGPGGPVEMIVLSSPEAEEDDEERPDADLMEARYVADRIRTLVDSGTLVAEGDTVRPAAWGDFAVLLRSKKLSDTFRAALQERGIPAVTQQGSGFFRSMEVAVLCSMLSVIDNPRQDVPLISALRSPLFGFTADDLSLIRSADRRCDFFTALGKSAETNAKAAAFLRELEEYRTLSPDLPVDALLNRICDRTGFSAVLSAMPDGAIRRENVQLLTDYARQFEQGGYRGLAPFLDWLRRLEEKGEEPRTGQNEENRAVQIISIHHSKGLEYPIVFLCGLEKKFNLKDLNADVLLHPELGVGGRVVDTGLGQSYPSLAWRAIEDRLRGESLSEEMRVLYVAMTRAKDRLFLVGRTKDAAALKDKLSAGLTNPVAPLLLRSDACPLYWLLRAALLPESPIKLQLLTPETGRAAPKEETRSGAGEDTPPPEDISSRLDWRYPHEAATALPSKITASALHNRALPDPEAVSAAPEDRPKQHFRRPELGGEDTPLRGTEKGVAVHTVLQFMDFQKGQQIGDIRAEIDRLLREGHLTPAQAAAAEPEMILSFFRSDIGRRAAGAEELRRELRFSMLVEAERFYPGAEGEELLLQGVVDCCFREGDHLVVVDYKTDAVTADTVAARAESYAPQVRIYALALERLLGLPVKEGDLFFLRPGITVSVPLEEDGHALL